MDLSVEMQSPAEPGIYEAKYRMSTAGGIFFGDSIWVIITVNPAGTLALTQQLNNFNDFGAKSGSAGAGGNGESSGKSPFGRVTRGGGGGGVGGGGDDQEMN